MSGAGSVVIPVGAKVRVTEASPWPERVGLEGTVVRPPVNGRYPQPAKDEVLVWLPEDPWKDRAYHATRGWSCVMSKRSLEVLNG